MGMGSGAEKEREQMKGVLLSELCHGQVSLILLGISVGLRVIYTKGCGRWGIYPLSSISHWWRTSPVTCQFAGTSRPSHTQEEAPEAQRSPSTAAGAGHWTLGLPSLL